MSRLPNSTYQSTSKIVTGDQLKQLQQTAVARLESLLRDPTKYRKIIEPLERWDAQISSGRARSIHLILKKVHSENSITEANYTELRDHLIITWAMLEDHSKPLPETIQKHNRKEIPWWTAILDELRQAASHEDRHFIHFPDAWSHRASGEQPDPVQHINQAIRRAESDSLSETMVGPIQPVGDSPEHDDVGYSTPPNPTRNTHAKRRLSDQQLYPNKHARVDWGSTPPSSVRRLKHEYDTEAANQQPDSPTPAYRATSAMPTSSVQPARRPTVARSEYEAERDKAKGWYKAYKKLEGEAGEDKATISKLRKELVDIKALYHGARSADEEKQQRLDVLQDKHDRCVEELEQALAASEEKQQRICCLERDLEQARAAVEPAARNLLEAAETAVSECQRFLGQRSAPDMDSNAADPMHITMGVHTQRGSVEAGASASGDFEEDHRLTSSQSPSPAPACPHSDTD